MRSNQLDLSLSSFIRVIVIDANNGEAWANISGILLTMNKPLIAYKPQLQACKLLYENWKCWENMELLSV